MSCGLSSPVASRAFQGKRREDFQWAKLEDVLGRLRWCGSVDGKLAMKMTDAVEV